MNIVEFKYYQVYESTVKIDLDLLESNPKYMRAKDAPVGQDLEAAARVTATTIAENGFRNCRRERVQTECVRSDAGPVTLTVNDKSINEVDQQ